MFITTSSSSASAMVNLGIHHKNFEDIAAAKSHAPPPSPSPLLPSSILFVLVALRLRRLLHRRKTSHDPNFTDNMDEVIDDESYAEEEDSESANEYTNDEDVS
ncbi:hypothetical protein Salat_1451000 [Sesamum alatum]|uniref:Uncharacterized protein n=1 Tax=Sesamum alatum TaxID=300844 RepID=A0AAE1YC12_9LAMI|nr:hypothetical protein Salat_1451000 [Sesamum alatum]